MQKHNQAAKAAPIELPLDRRTEQVKELVVKRGAYYNIFKSKPELMALFDACKTFEEDKSLFSTSNITDSTDESNVDQNE